MAKDDKKRANLEFLNTKKYIIGIDPCSTRMDCVILDRNALQIGKAFHCSFSWDGFSNIFFEKLLKQIPDIKLSEIVIGIEVSLNFWQHFVYFMIDKGIDVVGVSTLGVAYARKLNGMDLNKTDERDAKLVAENVYHGNFSPIKRIADKYLKAKALSLHRYKIQKDIQKEITRLGARVHMVFPEFKKAVGFDSPCALYLLAKHPTPAKALQMDIAYETDKVGYMSKQNFKTDKLTKLVEASKSSIGLVNAATDIEVETIKFHVLHIRLMRRRVKAIYKELHSLFKNERHYEILTSIPGFGPKTASLFLAECGDLSEYKHPGQIETLAGCNIRVKESGSMKSIKHQSGIGNKRLRTIIYLICEQLAKNEPRIRKKYLARQMKRNCYKKNIVSLSSMALDLILSLIRHDKLYEYDKKQVNLLTHIEKERELRKQIA